MKVFYNAVFALFFAASVFASDSGIDDPYKAFNDSVNLLGDIFSQRSTQVGKSGVRGTCTVMPSEQITSVAWEIDNPDRKLLTVRSEDVRFFGDGREIESIGTEEAVEILYKWDRESNSYSDSEDVVLDLHSMPGEDSEEGPLYGAALKFGDSDCAVICGITYFACRMRNLSSVTAEIKVSDETFKFNFDGGGP